MPKPPSLPHLVALIGVLRARHAAHAAQVDLERAKPEPDLRRLMRLKRERLRLRDDLALLDALHRRLTLPAA